jgi:hypothetical protein
VASPTWRRRSTQWEPSTDPWRHHHQPAQHMRHVSAMKVEGHPQSVHSTRPAVVLPSKGAHPDTHPGIVAPAAFSPLPRPHHPLSLGPLSLTCLRIIHFCNLLRARNSYHDHIILFISFSFSFHPLPHPPPPPAPPATPFPTPPPAAPSAAGSRWSRPGAARSSWAPGGAPGPGPGTTRWRGGRRCSADPPSSCGKTAPTPAPGCVCGGGGQGQVA